MKTYFNSHISTCKNTFSYIQPDIEILIEKTKDCINNKGRLFIFGNGGSSSDAEHFTAELVGSFNYREIRKSPFNVLCLSSTASVLTSISNDFGYDKLFSYQLESYGVNSNDLVIGITASGQSKNVLEAFRASKSRGAYTIAFTKQDAKIADLNIGVCSNTTSHIQEIHGIILHYYASIIEKYLISHE